jgi:hypothetical protein
LSRGIFKKRRIIIFIVIFQHYGNAVKIRKFTRISRKQMNKIFNVINAFAEQAEKKFGAGIIAGITGILLLAAAMMVSAVRFETSYHGNGYTLLSSDPFNFGTVNDLRFRILSPAIGYFLFFRGPAFKFFMLAVLAVFFGLIYHYMRKKGNNPAEAIGISALFSFSTLSFYQLYFPAYTDPMSFLFILIYMMSFRNVYLNTFLLTLLLFNHENSLFLFPFFFLMSLNNNYSIRNLLTVNMRFIIALIPYLLYRIYTSSHTEVEFNSAYYFDSRNLEWTRQHVLPHLAEGIFQAFRLAWLFPLAAIAVNIYQRRYNELLLMAVILAFVFLQLVFAWDISRLVGFSFPVILIAAMRVKEFLGTKKFLQVTYAVLLLNFFIPAYCIGALDPIPYTPFWLR